MNVQIECRVPRARLRYHHYERCAVLIGDHAGDRYTVRKIIVVPNRARHKGNQTFAVRVKDVRRLVGSYADSVIGVIHSHISGDHMPSPSDLLGIEDGYIGAVFSDGRITSWYTKGHLLDSVRVSFPTVEQVAFKDFAISE